MNVDITREKESFQFAQLVQTGRRIHISQVESGRKGYVCLGCGQGMIANKGRVYEHHFKHDPLDVSRKGKCTYSDETERHRVGKEILQRLRRVKVPVLRKYPPPGFDGKAIKLQDACFVEAASVENELHFYEMPTGEIQYSSKISWNDDGTKHLLIKPDVTFFDRSGKPILLIELVATHKPDAEKLAKIRSIGIDAIQILLPKTSPEGLEEAILQGNRTKWIYNYEREEADYLQLSARHRSAVYITDDHEEDVFEETFACRSSEIKGLVRRIRNCLGSEHYQRVERHLAGELSRVTNNATRHRERLRRLQADHEAAIRDEFSERFEQVDQEQKRLDDRYRKVEERYYQIKGEHFEETIRLGQEETSFESDCQHEIDRIEAELSELTTIYRPTCQGEIDQLEDEISRLETAIERFGAEGTALTEIQEQLDREAAAIEREEEEVDQRRSTLYTAYQQLESKLLDANQREEREIESNAERRIEQLRAEHEANRERAVEAVEQQNGRIAPRLSTTIEKLFEAVGAISDIRDANNGIQRIKAARQAIRTGSWKNWT
ncbi:competence protein CoiA family protein [Spirosoma pulveris]